MPAVDRFRQNWDFRQQNWLPFYWNGYSQTTRYTYRLDKLDDVDALWSNVRESVRTDVRKASARFGVTVRTDLGVADFLRLNRMVFERQSMAVPYSESLVNRIDSVCASRGQRQIVIAEDSQGRRHAGAFIVWDDATAYYLLGGADPELRSSGASSLCLWEAIKHAATVTSSFDFEGSMIQSVERHFRAFGATQTPYFQIRRTTSRRARLAETARMVLGGK
jgi:lipid II:glycine glycyltransferase (peptidoglycan interpeptide bridge formation enzyme)